MSSRSHVHSVFQPAELYIGLTKVQAELEIGKSAAILLMITEGLYQRRFLSSEDYDKLTTRYRQKLVEKVRNSIASKESGKCGFKNCRKDAIATGVWRGTEKLTLCKDHYQEAKANHGEWETLKVI